MTIDRRLLALVTLLAVGYCASPAPSAQGTLAPVAIQQFLDANGVPVAAGKLCTYAAGTLTPATTYTDVGLTVAHQNPILLDAGGRPTNGSALLGIYLSATSYKFILLTAGTDSTCGTGSTVWALDNVPAVPANSAGVDVLGTFGDTVTAGQAVYLSAGDGGKTAGQWFKADSANTYSSSINEVGVVSTGVTAGQVGTVRLSGSISGLAGLVAGTSYYVGTAGALATTAPSNARLVGQAQTTSQLNVTANPRPLVASAGTIGQVLTSGGSGVQPTFQAIGFVDDFRLSLTTALPVTTSDVTAATTLFWTPYSGNRITVFNSSGAAETCTSAELSIAVPATTSQMYDVWVYDTSFGACTLSLELLAWTNDTTRATAMARTNGRWTKTGDATRLYVGSVRTTTVSGQTEDSLTKRYVWNAYNRVKRVLQRNESTATWTYTTNTLRQANGSTTNQVDVVIGLAEVAIDLRLISSAQNTNTGVNLMVAIGEDSTSAVAAGSESPLMQSALANGPLSFVAALVKFPAIGRHFYAWLEQSAATGTTTWYGVAAPTQSGLMGSIEG